MNFLCHTYFTKNKIPAEAGIFKQVAVVFLNQGRRLTGLTSGGENMILTV
jgi:hypothetical protein